jgi:hypothetical protein
MSVDEQTLSLGCLHDLVVHVGIEHKSLRARGSRSDLVCALATYDKPGYLFE